MPEILLKDWAARKGVSPRTAQQWAKERLIPAKKKRKSIVMEKTWNCYVIDEDATIPGEGKAS
jgi:predicted site-specific integrase-resolvase